jgi:hypothetical protein
MKLTGLLKQILKESDLLSAGVGDTGFDSKGKLVGYDKQLNTLEFGKDVQLGDSVPSGVGESRVVRGEDVFEDWKNDMISKWGNLWIKITPDGGRLHKITVSKSVTTPENKKYNEFMDRAHSDVHTKYYSGRRNTGD